MKKLLTMCFVVALILFSVPVEKASAIAQADMQGNPMNNENHFIWDVMAQLQTPDDADCVPVATTFLNENGITNAEQQASIASNTCAQIAPIKTGMSEAATVGNQSVETNLTSATDWHSVQNLYFQHSTNGVVDGRIAFSRPIDFMSYTFMTFMQTFGQRMESSKGKIALDADIVGGLIGYGATLTMYNVGDFKDPEIFVNGGKDTGGVTSGMVYDRATQSITFNAAHFTTFTATERNPDQKPKITNIDFEKYTSVLGHKMIKVTMRGKHFTKSTKVKFGGKSASKVSYKSSKKIVATFKLSKLTVIGKQNLKLKGLNGAEIGQYRKKIPLADLL